MKPNLVLEKPTSLYKIASIAQTVFKGKIGIYRANYDDRNDFTIVPDSPDANIDDILCQIRDSLNVDPKIIY